MSIRTAFGGRRTIKTKGQKITKLKRTSDSYVKTAGSITLLGAAYAEIHVSTTHTTIVPIIELSSIFAKCSNVKW